jgi:predicted RNase H-like nuclease (RuvC/YqgF family)
MSFLWEIVQSGFVYGQHQKARSIEGRVELLEAQLQETQETIRKLVRKLEELHGLDVDGDGRVG